MIKGMIATLALAFSFNAFSSTTIATINLDVLNSAAQAQVGPFGLDWIVGESIDHKLNMGFIQGSMHTEVRNETADGLWVQQDMDLGFMGKQKVEILYNKADGMVKKVLVNGQEQSMPDQSNMEIVEMKESSVTVPAGTFDCIYARILDKKENKESQAWLNPSIIPISGMIKTIAPGPMGEVVIEMTGYNDL